MTSLTLRHTHERTKDDGTEVRSWALWCAYRKGILGAVVQVPLDSWRQAERKTVPAVGDVEGWDWSVEPIGVKV